MIQFTSFNRPRKSNELQEAFNRLDRALALDTAHTSINTEPAGTTPMDEKIAAAAAASLAMPPPPLPLKCKISKIIQQRKFNKSFPPKTPIKLKTLKVNFEDRASRLKYLQKLGVGTLHSHLEKQGQRQKRENNQIRLRQAKAALFSPPPPASRPTPDPNIFSIVRKSNSEDGQGTVSNQTSFTFTSNVAVSDIAFAVVYLTQAHLCVQEMISNIVEFCKYFIHAGAIGRQFLLRMGEKAKIRPTCILNRGLLKALWKEYEVDLMEFDTSYDPNHPEYGRDSERATRLESRYDDSVLPRRIRNIKAMVAVEELIRALDGLHDLDMDFVTWGDLAQRYRAVVMRRLESSLLPAQERLLFEKYNVEQLKLTPSEQTYAEAIVNVWSGVKETPMSHGKVSRMIFERGSAWLKRSEKLKAMLEKRDEEEFGIPPRPLAQGPPLFIPEEIPDVPAIGFQERMKMEDEFYLNPNAEFFLHC